MVDNNISNIRIGVIYAPKENFKSNNELKITYKVISKPILIVQKERKQVLILGDFSTKVDTYIKVSDKSRRQLMTVAKNYYLLIISKEKEVCKGLWTRVKKTNIRLSPNKQ